MAHQNIDKFFKVSAILFGQQFVDAFGLNYNIIRLYRNELNSLNGKNYFTDLVFETREGILLNFEFQDVKIKKNDLNRYMEFELPRHIDVEDSYFTGQYFPTKVELPCYPPSS